MLTSDDLQQISSIVNKATEGLASKEDVKELSLEIGDILDDMGTHIDERFDDLKQTLGNHDARLKDHEGRIQDLEHPAPTTHTIQK
jgi:hypothetical protein